MDCEDMAMLERRVLSASPQILHLLEINRFHLKYLKNVRLVGGKNHFNKD
jgi:hypothetical protein